MENTDKPSTPTLADGPTATGVTFHGLDGSVTVWVDPVGHVKLTPALVQSIAADQALWDRATIAEARS